MRSVLIIDDETALVSSLSFALRGEGYTVKGAFTGGEGLKAVIDGRPDVVLLDVRLPDSSGLEWLERIRAAQPGTPVIMISAHGETRLAVRATKMGAFDYLTKPFELDDLFLTIRSALERDRMAKEASGRPPAQTTDGLVGTSETFARLMDEARKIGASSVARVLLLGESGTGKSLVARVIHDHSARAGGPFIEVNCAALPEQLVEAELFGNEKGAYTGAHQKRVGLVSLADGGTIFLDEVGELPLPIQAKLLHFLENGSYRMVGSGRVVTSNARIVAATNRDLASEVRAGRFREDLYYRLDVVQIHAPPLRERKDDVLLLARHFAAQLAEEEHCAPIRFAPDAEAVLVGHVWPGNVRELRNLVARLTVLSAGRSITAADLPCESRSQAASPVAPATASERSEGRSLGDELSDAERQLLENALRETGGHRGRAAARLGISRHALKRRLHRLGVT